MSMSELLDGAVEQAAFEAVRDQLEAAHADKPCPICGDPPEAVLPAHGVSFAEGEVDERVCVGWGKPFGFPGLVVFDHGESHPEANAGGGVGLDEDKAVSIDIEEG